MKGEPLVESSNSEARIPIHYVLRDANEAWRVDISQLFGKFLPELGVDTHLVAREHADIRNWMAGRSIVFKAFPMQVVRDLFSSNGEIQALQVRDMPFLALPLALAARLSGTPFFYWMSWPFAEDDLAKYRYRRNQSSLIRRLLYLARGFTSSLVLYRMVFPLSSHIFVQSDVAEQALNALKELQG